MDLKKIVVLSGMTLLLTGLPALAGKSSVELGKQLFNDPTLGGSTNDKSCNSCHAGGAKLDNAAGRKDLTRIINHCITASLGGHKIDGRSAEMLSLKMYIETLAKK